MKIILCLLGFSVCLAAMERYADEKPKPLAMVQGFPILGNVDYDSNCGCTNEDLAYIESCGSIVCFLSVPKFGGPAFATGLYLLLDAKERFERDDVHGD